MNNKQVKILLDNKNKADLINNILAYKFEIIIFKLEQSIFLHLENRKKYQILIKTILMNLQIKNHHDQTFLYLVNLIKYKLILRDN